MYDVRGLFAAPALGLVGLLQAASVSPSFADGTGPPTAVSTAVAVPVQSTFVVHIVNPGTDGAQATFDPPLITVPQGARVTWVNDDVLAKHSPTADAAAWDSEYLGAGQSWARGFDTPGTFGYICPVHWIMRGSVVVLPTPIVTPPADDTLTPPSDDGSA